MSILANLVVRMSADTAALERGLKGAKSHTDKFGKVLNTAAIGGATALAGLGMASLKMGIDFEKSMAEVKTLIPDISEKAFGKMRDDVLDLSKEMGIATDKAVPALYQAISAGIPRENVMEFMTVASKAAIGGVTDLETAVDGLTTVVNAFGYETSEAGRVADVMFTGVRLGKTTMDELSSAMFKAAPLAATLGLEIEDVVAAVATLTKSGTPTEVAMTQIKMAMVALSKPNKDMINLLEQTSYASGEALLQSEGLAGALDILTKATGGNKEMMAKAFGSVEALQAVLGLTGENAATAAEDLAAMTDATGAADAAFETMTETTSYKLTKAINEMKVEMTRVAVRVLPMLVKVLETIKPIIIPLVGAIAALIAAWAAWKIVSLVSQIGTLVTALRSVNLAIVGPIGIVAALGIGAFALGKFIDKNRDAIDSLPVLGGLIRGTAKHQRELNAAIKEANDLYERNLITVEELTEKGIQAMEEAISALGDELHEVQKPLGMWEVRVARTVDAVTADIADYILDMQKAGVDYERIMLGLEHAGIDWKDTTINEVLEPMRKQFEEDVGAIKEELGGWEHQYRKTAEEIIEETEALAAVNEESYKQITDAIKSVLPAVDQTFQEWSEHLVKMYAAQVNFESNLRRLYEGMTAAGVQNVGDIVRTYQEAGPLVTQAGVDMILDTVGGMEAARLQGAHIENTKKVIGDIVAEYEAVEPQIYEAGWKLADNLVDGWMVNWSHRKPEIITSVAQLPVEVRRALSGGSLFTYPLGKELVADLMKGMKAGRQSLLVDLERLGRESTAAFVEGIKAAKTMVDQAGLDLIRGFIVASRGAIEGEGKRELQRALYRLSTVYEDEGIEAASKYAASLVGELRDAGYPAIAGELTYLMGKLTEQGEREGKTSGEKAGAALTGGLASEGALQSLPTAQYISTALADAIVSLEGWFVASGRGIAGFLMSGIYRGFLYDFASYAKAIADIIYEALKDALGASSPARKLIPLGKMAAEGYAQGWQQAFKGGMAVAPALASPIGAYAAPAAAAGVPGKGTTIINYNTEFSGPLLGDQRQLEELADALIPIVRQRLG